MYKCLIPLLITISFCSCFAQLTIKDYVGGWSGQWNKGPNFSFELELKQKEHQVYELSLKEQDSTTKILLHKDNNLYKGSYANQLNVEMKLIDQEVILFLQIGHHLCYVTLQQKDQIWFGQWDLLLRPDYSTTSTFYLSLYEDNGNYGSSTFFKEPTFHYMFGQNFTYNEGGFSFQDIRSMIVFKGKFEGDRIRLDLDFLNHQSFIYLTRLDYDQWQIGQSDIEADKVVSAKVSSERFASLEKDILNDTLERTHAILIAQNDEIIYERYFDGFSEKMPHDTRSASKSIAGALIGIAIGDQLLANENSLIYPFFAKKYPDIDWSNDKDKITIEHLLTMSSGLDIIDFGLNRTSYANEGAYQNTKDWTEHILNAPMVKAIGSEANYGSGSPHLLGPILESKLEEPLEFYIHQKLFAPLEIEHYRVQTTNQGIPYFGGGWYLTPNGLFKFGQLFLNKGKWKDQQIIPAEWIEKSIQKIKTLENTIDKNKYGYLFWHKTYELGNRKIASIEARGTGGQYLFIVPELRLVVVITSGNYNNGKGFQPERIMKDYILKEILKE